MVRLILLTPRSLAPLDTGRSPAGEIVTALLIRGGKVTRVTSGRVFGPEGRA